MIYTTYIGGFDLGLELGARVSLMTRGTGNMLTSESEYTNLAFDRKFNDRIGIGYFGGLMIGRNYEHIGDFYIAPRFSYYTDDFTNSNNDIGQKYYTIGINAGFVYKLK